MAVAQGATGGVLAVCVATKNACGLGLSLSTVQGLTLRAVAGFRVSRSGASSVILRDDLLIITTT